MTVVTAPVAGLVVGLGAAPDPAYADGSLGPGTAIDPVRRPIEAVAPVDGYLISLYPEAFVVRDHEGHRVLIQLGVEAPDDTEFEVLVAKDSAVSRGQAVVRWDPGAVEKKGRSPICTVVALDATADVFDDSAGKVGDVDTGDVLFHWA
jgi:PTS system N-acetylglucosamine-specific IIA component